MPQTDLARRMAPAQVDDALEPLALPGVEIAGEVVAIDNQVDRNSRTVRVLGQLGNEGDRLRDGMSLTVSLSFEGEPFPTVDPLAVQWSSDGAFVWAVREGKATRVPIEIRQRNAQAVLVEGAGEIPFDAIPAGGTVALSAGASAPEVLVNAVIDALRTRFDAKLELVQTAEEL